MTDQERSEQQLARAELALAVSLIASWHHSGQRSTGYAKLCQAQRILDDLGFAAGAGYNAERDPEIRSIAAAYLWQHRDTIRRTW